MPPGLVHLYLVILLVLFLGSLELLSIHAVVGTARAQLANALFLVVYGSTLLGLMVLWLRRLKRRRLRAKTLDELLMLTPTQFEYAVADLLRDLGYRAVRRVGGPGDLAVDIECRDHQGRYVVVQCKRYALDARIGSREIQTFIGMMTVHHKADQGLFVTTAEYTKPSRDLAQRHDLVLIDGEELARLLEQLHSSRPVMPVVDLGSQESGELNGKQGSAVLEPLLPVYPQRRHR